MIEHLRPLVSDALMAIGVVLAVFLLWLGAVISGWGDHDAQDPGNFVKSLGMLILTVVLFVGGLIRSDFDKWIRAALIIGAVLLISWVGFWPTEISIDWPSY